MLFFILALACGQPTATEPAATEPAATEPAATGSPPTEPTAQQATAQPPPAEDDSTVAARKHMVQTQLAARDISDPRVLAAMEQVPRHRFMPESSRSLAYRDGAAPIGHGQTISQPYIVAFMTQALGVEPGMKVLEVGTGSGYQAAVLSQLGATVYSIEIVEALARHADSALRAAGFPVVESDESDQPSSDQPASDRGEIHLRTGDGYVGWPQAAPFDRVIVTASPDHVPPALKDQVAEGGRLLLPVGDDGLQHLVLLERDDGQWSEQRILPVLFVPMTGQAQER